MLGASACVRVGLVLVSVYALFARGVCFSFLRFLVETRRVGCLCLSGTISIIFLIRSVGMNLPILSSILYSVLLVLGFFSLDGFLPIKFSWLINSIDGQMFWNAGSLLSKRGRLSGLSVVGCCFQLVRAILFPKRC